MLCSPFKRKETMKFSIKMYFIFSGIFLLSGLATFILPIAEWAKSYFAIPGVGALVGGLWQLFRDQANHERQKELADKNNAFQLSAFSHMANTVFNKHVEFSEQYINKFNKTLTQIKPQGNTDILQLFDDLKGIRVKYQAWLNEDIIEDLLYLESLIEQHYQAGTQAKNSPIGKTKTQLYAKAKQLFEKIKSLNGNSTTQETKSFIIIVQEMIGIKELIELRKHVLKNATDQIKNITSQSTGPEPLPKSGNDSVR